MKNYNELTTVEKAIVDDLTKGWYIDGEGSTDALNLFYFAKDSIDACDEYATTPNVNVQNLKEAIVGRFNHTQSVA